MATELGDFEHLDVDIDLAAIIDELVKSPVFIERLRTALLKDARRMGNLYGKYGQRETFDPGIRRLS